jgi:hypothetical protein
MDNNHVTLDELRTAIIEQYPENDPDQISDLVLILWARIMAKRIGLSFDSAKFRRGY